MKLMACYKLSLMYFIIGYILFVIVSIYLLY